MKSIYLILITTILINFTNSKLESNYPNYYVKKPETSTPKPPPQPKPEIPEKTPKKAERERNITFTELIQAIYSKFSNVFSSYVNVDQCSCESCCPCQNLTHSTVFPFFFKEILRGFSINCQDENQKKKGEGCSCVPVDKNTDEFDYRTWVQELKNHKVKLYKSPKKCEKEPEKIPREPQRKILKYPKRKCENSSMSLECEDCSLLKSEDKMFVWLVCRRCKNLDQSTYTEFSRTGCLLNFDRIENKWVRIRTPHIQFNDYRTESKDDKNDMREFICPKISFAGGEKQKCEKLKLMKVKRK